VTEGQIQKAVFDNLRKRGVPGIVYWHTPNDPSSRRKAGYLAGMPDVSVLHVGKLYCVELKKDGGRPTEEQLEVVSRINNAGGFACVAEGLDQALSIFEALGVLRRAA
jgi:hypothetical protein